MSSEEVLLFGVSLGYVNTGANLGVVSKVCVPSFLGMAVHLARARHCRDTFLSEVQNNLRKCEEEMPDLIFVCRDDLQVLAHRWDGGPAVETNP